MKKFSTQGFTLIELMAVVAIIAILSTIAVQSYAKLTENSRKSEAKIGLSALYSAEMGFFAENSMFTACVSCAGYKPDINNKRYYSIGVVQASKDCGGSWCNYIAQNGAQSVNPLDWWTPANMGAEGNSPNTTQGLYCNDGCVVTASGFSAGACGYIGGKYMSCFQIDNKKQLMDRGLYAPCSEGGIKGAGGIPPVLSNAFQIPTCPIPM